MDYQILNAAGGSIAEFETEAEARAYFEDNTIFDAMDEANEYAPGDPFFPVKIIGPHGRVIDEFI